MTANVFVVRDFGLCKAVQFRSIGQKEIFHSMAIEPLEWALKGDNATMKFHFKGSSLGYAETNIL